MGWGAPFPRYDRTRSMKPVSARDCWPRKPEFGGAPAQG